MTEYEINKAVAEKLGIMQYMFDGKESGSVIWNVPSNNLYNGFVSSRGNLFEPCNNAQQALDIMLKHNISVTKDGDGYYAVQNLYHIGWGDWRCDRYYYHEKPFVAAMLLFLEI